MMIKAGCDRPKAGQEKIAREAGALARDKGRSLARGKLPEPGRCAAAGPPAYFPHLRT